MLLLVQMDLDLLSRKWDLQKIPQTGIVVLGNNVDVGANSTIDRATLGVTQLEMV